MINKKIIDNKNKLCKNNKNESKSDKIKKF